MPNFNLIEPLTAFCIPFLHLRSDLLLFSIILLICFSLGKQLIAQFKS